MGFGERMNAGLFGAHVRQQLTQGGTVPGFAVKGAAKLVGDANAFCAHKELRLEK